MTRFLFASILVGVAAATVTVEDCPPPLPPSRAYALVDDGARLSSYRLDDVGPALTAADFASHEGGYLPTWPAGNPARGLVHAVIVKSGPHTGYPDNPLLGTYRIQPESGVLTEVEVRSLGETKNEESALAVHPSGSFLFLQGGGEKGIRRYSVDESAGTLSLLGTTPLSLGTPGGLEVHPSGEWAFASYLDGRRAAQLDTYRVDRGSGRLDLSQRLSPAQPLFRLLIDGNTRFLYGVDQADSLWSYAIDVASGRLSSLERIPAGRRPRDLVQVGRLLYVAAAISDEVRCFERNPDTGALRELGVMAQLEEPESLAIHPSLRCLYVGYGRPYREAIAAFAIDPLSGSLEPLGVVAQGQTIRIAELRQ